METPGAYWVLRAAQALQETDPMDHHDHHHPTEGEHLVTCPVCMMKLDPEDVGHTAEHEGRTFYFCNAACERAFKNDPPKFAARLAQH